MAINDMADVYGSDFGVTIGSNEKRRLNIYFTVNGFYPWVVDQKNIYTSKYPFPNEQYKVPIQNVFGCNLGTSIRLARKLKMYIEIVNYSGTVSTGFIGIGTGLGYVF
jgi:hypothetical protein